MKKSVMFIMVMFVAASVSNAATYRFMGNGNWEDSQWQNQTDGINNTTPPTSSDTARMNWGGATCTLNSEQTISMLGIGVDEPGNLIIAAGGILHTSSAAAVGDVRGAGVLTVEAGGVADFGLHLWVGRTDTAPGTLNINGGTVKVGQMLGLGWDGGTGFVNVNDGGVLDLFQLHGDGSSSMQNGSILDITGTGKVLLPGNYTGVINEYVNNGSIYGNGILGNINIDVTNDITTVTAVPEPASMILLGFGGLALRIRRK